MPEVEVPVVEIGGTHVTAAWVHLDSSDGAVRLLRRGPVTADADAGVLLAEFAAAGRALDAPAGRVWGVATPGPFDYPAGIGRFTGVGKFDSLNGVDVGAALRGSLGAARVRFLNDAAAFGMGEWHAGAGRGSARLVAITLGTGIGATFLADGVPVTTGDAVPREGVLHLVRHEGRELEEHISRRAIIAAYARETGERHDVREIAGLALLGDAAATGVLERGFRVLAEVLAPWLGRFAADTLVIGGSVAQSWTLVERCLVGPLRERLDAGHRLRVAPAAHPDEAPLIGAARHALA